MYIYKKLSPKWKNFLEQKVFYFRFYILCENFSKIGPLIKKILKFQSDPLKLFVKKDVAYHFPRRTIHYENPLLSGKVNKK